MGVLVLGMGDVCLMISLCRKATSSGLPQRVLNMFNEIRHEFKLCNQSSNMRLSIQSEIHSLMEASVLPKTSRCPLKEGAGGSTATHGLQ
jgi:hypothetical protein